MNDGQTQSPLSNTLHVGPNAHGSLALAQSKVFPGDRLVSASMSIFGADSTSLTKIEPEGTTLAASSYTNGRGLAADSSGNIYSSDVNRLVRITPAGELSDFVTGISLGKGLAVDNDDNIYAGSGKNILIINQNAEVQTFATLEGTVNAVATSDDGILYAVDSTNTLSHIHEDGTIEAITKTGLSNPQALTIDVNGYFYVLNQEHIINSDGNSANPIIRISPDGKLVSEYYTGARFEFEGVNLTADCSNNLLFAPYKSLGVSEESKIFQFIGDTREVREVLYGPPIHPDMSDMDVLFYDRLGGRLLIWTDRGNGKIFSFPASCGGIDAEVHLVTRGDVDLMSTDPAPERFIDLPDGTKEYIWSLSEVDNRGQNILLNFLFDNLADGETRPALQEAYLLFHNSFAEGEEVRVPLEIPELSASSQMSLDASLDRGSYGSNDTLQISANVGNDSDMPFNGLLRLTIEDARGIAVASLPEISISGLEGFQLGVYASEWLTADTYADNYRLHAQLYNSDSERVAEDTVPFNIVPGPVGDPNTEARVTTDRLDYEAWDRVLINARLHNTADNAILSGGNVEVSVYNPEGALIYNDSAAASELFPGNLRDLSFGLNLVDVPDGDYQVSMKVYGADGGELLVTAVSRFSVGRTVGQGIEGTARVALSQLEQGEANFCTTTLTNIASNAITDMVLYQRIYSMDSGALVNSSTRVIDLEAEGGFTQTIGIETADYAAGAYACVLQMEREGELHNIASAGFNVLEGQSIEIDADIRAGEKGRVLVLLDQDRTTEGMSCAGLTSLKLAANLDVPLEADALLDAELSDLLGTIDDENALLGADGLPVNRDTGSGDADLIISTYTASGFELLLQAKEESLGEGYGLFATLSENGAVRTLQTGDIAASCDPGLSVGDVFGNFTVNGLTLLPEAGDVHGPENAPSPSEQRAYLQTLLETNGWSHTLVSNGDDFARELRTGGYSAYLLLSEQARLSEQVQKELREAVYRGEGLIEAGSHDQRNGRVDEILGIKFIGKHARSTGIDFVSETVYSGGVANFLLTKDKTLRVELEAATALGYFIDENAAATAEVSAALNHYGEGRALYSGFDLLAEAAAVDAAEDNPYAEFLLSALEYVHPQALEPRAGAVHPFILTLGNQGVATSGRTLTRLPQDSLAIDPGLATLAPDNTLQWLFELAEEATIENTVWLRLPPEPGTVTLETLIQNGSGTDFTDYDQVSFSLETAAMPGLDRAVELLDGLGKSKDYRQVKNAVDKARKYVGSGEGEKALKFLAQAADILLGMDTAQAKDLRMAVAWAIRDVASSL